MRVDAEARRHYSRSLHSQVMRRGETDADMVLVAKFIAASAFLQQDPATLANEIITSRTLEPILQQVGCILTLFPS